MWLVRGKTMRFKTEASFPHFPSLYIKLGVFCLRQKRKTLFFFSLKTMAEEATASVTETLAQPNAAAKSNEATITTATEAGTESTCNNNINDKPEASAVTSSSDEKTLEFADELLEKGNQAMKDSDFAEASECFSRSLEIRLGFFTFPILSHFISINRF